MRPLPGLSMAWLALSFLVVGCAGYRLGPVAGVSPGSRTVQVLPFQNETLEPRLTDALAVQMRKELQRDATYKLATAESGDILVTGKIIRYERNEMSFAKDDLLAVRDYRIFMQAHVTAQERGGRVLFDRPFTGYTLVRVGTDLVSAERQSLPLLAREVARAVTTALAEGSW